MKKILISGNSGMLGSVLYNDFKKTNFEVWTIGRSYEYKENHIMYDFSETTIKKFEYEPDIIVHCAALTNHEDCDSDVLNCININSISILHLRKMFPNSKIIFVSSDAVFNDSIKIRKVNTPTFSNSKYGISKEIGELICKAIENCLILRTTIVGFSKKKTSLADWICTSLLDEREINLFDNVLFNPISIWEFSIILKYLITNIEKFNNQIFHLNNSKFFSKYDFGYALANSLNLNSKLIKKGTLVSDASNSFRNNNQVLSYKKLKTFLPRNEIPTFDSTINNLKFHYNEYF